ncbi:hypothetical protein C8F04DRAFT_1195161 [Mycena alexandri]|uniref:Uncharacterized protein n=1 Tax=Mycena alexandri TaxID=1745969 RepID=A0AAD6S6J6_9AGAR|nr:hypothetical protein C8F04DRAFT_1195161 [Mycena alexandri]
MFALTNPTQDRKVYSGESSPEEEEGNEPDEESPSSDEEFVTSSDERVYFSVPKTHGHQIFEAQRTVPSIRKVRREIFDGVHVPSRGGMKKGEIRDLTGTGKEKVNEPGKAGPSSVPGPAPLPDPKRQPPNRKVPLSRGLDNLQPIEARKVRLEKDTEMRDVEEQEDPAKKSAIKGDAKEEGGKKAGRQSELSATVDRRQVLIRIMDATVPMSIREIMVTSKDLTDDTGSQLDVVSAEVAALKIQRTVDMSQVTGMHDANGGNSQLQGWIRDVEFNCGGAYISIDEREEGTYLIFKDRITRRPRYELLAVPYKGPLGDFRSEKTSHYQSFTVMRDESGRRTRGSSEGSEQENVGNRQTNETHHVAINCTRTRQRGIVRANLCFWRFALVGWTIVKGMILLLRNIGSAATKLSSTGEEVSQGSTTFKRPQRQEGNLRNKPRPHSTMSLTRLVQTHNDPEAPLPVSSPHQYLSREALHCPPIAAVALTSTDPAEIMTDAVTRLWRQVTTGESLVVSPSYAASPAMEYYGVVRFKDGTPAHLFSRIGNRTLMHDPTTNVVHQSSGHELAYHFAAPLDPSAPWKLEAPYPTDQSIRAKMLELSDGFLESEDDLGFPTHATPVSPPLIPLEDRLKGRSVCYHLPEERDVFLKLFQLAEFFADISTKSTTAASNSPTNETDSTPPSERATVDMREVGRHVLAGFRAPIRVDSDIVKKLDAEIDTERVRQLGEEIRKRAERALNASSESLPELVRDTDSSTEFPGPVELGLCEYCFAESHASAADCPRRGIAVEPVVVDAAKQVDDEGMWYLDDWVPHNDLTRWRSEREAQAELQRTLDAVLVPILQNLFQLSAQQPATVQQVFEVARNAEQSTKNLVETFEQKRAEEEGRIAEMFEEEMARVLSTLPEETRRRLSQSTLAFPHGSTAIDVAEITAHADRVETPALDCQRGEVVTRDIFSSSSPPSVRDTTSSNSPYGRQPRTPYNDWSPQISEWSVESEVADPRLIINAAVSRALLSGALSDNSNFDSLEGELPRLKSFPTDLELLASVAGNSSRITHPDFLNDHDVPQSDADSIHQQLHQWAHDCRISKKQFLSNIEEAAIEPLKAALAMLHGPLSHYLDYAYMAVHDHSTLQYLPPLPTYDNTTFATPDLTQIPTSLDWSLPDSGNATQSSPAELTEANLARLQRQTGKQAEALTEVSIMQYYGVDRKPHCIIPGPRQPVIWHSTFQSPPAALPEAMVQYLTLAYLPRLGTFRPSIFPTPVMLLNVAHSALPHGTANPAGYTGEA